MKASLALRLLLLTLPAIVAIAMGNAGRETAQASTDDAKQAAAPHRADAVSGADATLLERGAYIAKAADCAGCHTAPEGGAPYAGGLGMGSPFGTIVTSNITPDVRYGIGRYSYDDFAKALREGVARGGKRLYPAMPYTAFAKMSDGDLHALYTFMMQGVPPVSKPTPPSDVAFPFNQRWMLRFWQWAFMPHKGVRQPSGRDAQWYRGAYLVQSLGHCGACHTPRGFAYEERGYDESAPRFLTGGINDHWFASNLTGDAGSGLGRLSETDIARFLKTGHGAGIVAYGSMVQQIEDSTQYLSDGDLLAIAHYLKSLPAREPSGTFAPQDASTQPSANGNRVADDQSLGNIVYRSFCARCHGLDGKGVPNVFPALAGNPSVLAKDTTSLIRLLVEGGNSPATESGPPRQRMPAFAGTLVDAQMGQVLTYIRSAWGNNAQPISGNDVHALRQLLHK